MSEFKDGLQKGVGGLTEKRYQMAIRRHELEHAKRRGNKAVDLVINKELQVNSELHLKTFQELMKN